jgi:hypothetical protein
MSKVSISGNASGTGVFTIASPNGNTDRTLTLPDATGTILTTATPGVPVNGPAFSAYQSSAQSLTANTITKLQFQAEEFDTASAFDSSTNYRFQPTVAGYYQISGCYLAGSNRTYNLIYIYKTGANFKTNNTGNGLTGVGASISALIYLNGSTDYIELYALTGLTQNTTNSAQDTYFQAALIRAA